MSSKETQNGQLQKRQLSEEKKGRRRRKFMENGTVVERDSFEKSWGARR
jgi:hypothetical protein